MSSFFNPYTYQPMSESYYLGKPFPQELSKIAAKNPDAAQHIVSVWQFSTWLQQAFPAFYNAIANVKPETLDAAKAVTSGSVAPTAKGGGLKGLRALGDTVSFDPNSGDVTSSTTTSASGAGIASQWGATVSDLLGKYLIYDQQKSLINLNIKRAEQGLPPIDATQYGAGVSIGASPQVQQIAYLAIGGLILAGLFSALGKRR